MLKKSIFIIYVMFTFCSTFNKVGRANKIMRSFIFRRLLLKARWKNTFQHNICPSKKAPEKNPICDF